MAGAYYGLPDQGKPVEEASATRSIILVGNMDHPDVCWKSHTAGCEQSRRLRQYIEDNFLGQVLDKPARGEVLLDLVLTNADYIIK